MRQAWWRSALFSLLICSFRQTAVADQGTCPRPISVEGPKCRPDALHPSGKAAEDPQDIETLIQLQTSLGAPTVVKLETLGQATHVTDFGSKPTDKDKFKGKPLDSKFSAITKKAQHYDKIDAKLANDDEPKDDDITKPKKRDSAKILKQATKEIAKGAAQEPKRQRKVEAEPSTSDPSDLEDEEWHKQIWNIWERLQRSRRHRRREDATLRGIDTFFQSALLYEWFIFIVAIALFVPLQRFLLSKQVSHVTSLFLWVVLGLVYNALIGARLGSDAGVAWFTGYLLELVFSIENVFVFHVVVRAFSTPEHLTQHALCYVIWCQIAFEMVFFMGLAKPLRTWDLLPYLLGLWLISIGIVTFRDEQNEDVKVEDTWAYSICKKVFGSRLLNKYELTEDGGGRPPSYLLSKDGVTYVSMLLPATCCLLLVDFLLEVDVTITKIEELQNQYIAFTSSAAAAFTLVSLFFVAGDLFHKFYFLQYGISFVLIFFGAQMLLHKIYSISPLSSCFVIIMVMTSCIALSRIAPDPLRAAQANEDAS